MIEQRLQMSEHEASHKTKPDVDGRPVKRDRRLTLVGMTASFLLLCAVYARVASTVPVNSDHASIILEADAFLHRNWLLHGWTLTNVSFYTTDLPFYVLGVACQGVTPTLLREVPAVVYALVVVCAVWLAGRGSRATSWSGPVTFLLLGLPSLLLPQIVLVGVNHVATTLMCLGCLLALDCRPGGEPSWQRPLLAGLFCAFALIGDDMALVVLVVPAILVTGVRALRADRADRTPETTTLAALLFSVLLAKIVSFVVGQAGGFVTMPLSVMFVSLANLPRNAFLTVQGLLGLYRADFFGRRVNFLGVGMLVNILGVAFVLHSLTQSLRAWRAWTRGGDRVTQILGVSMLLNLLGYLLNSAVSNVFNTIYSPPERYLVPFFVFGAVLAGRLGVGIMSVHSWFRPVAALVGTVYAALFVAQLRMPAVTPPAAQLGGWLESRGLTEGYGNFWCSSLVTVESGAHVRVRPVDASNMVIKPLHWFSDGRWYTEGPATFLIYDSTHTDAGDFYWGSVCLQTARNTFGPPKEIHVFGQYTILVWGKNLAPEMQP